MSGAYRRGKPGTKMSYHQRSKYHSCGSELPTARKRWYIFAPDFIQIVAFLASNASARHCLFWIIFHRRFHYSLTSALFYRRQGKNSVVLINVAIKFGDEYFCFGIYFSKTFFVKSIFVNFFFQNVFTKIFFPKCFYQNFCWQIFFSKFFFLNFFFRFFFLKFFFQHFFSKIFFWGLCSRCLPVYRDKTDSMYLCYEKYDKQAVEIGL